MSHRIIRRRRKAGLSGFVQVVSAWPLFRKMCCAAVRATHAQCTCGHHHVLWHILEFFPKCLDSFFFVSIHQTSEVRIHWQFHAVKLAASNTLTSDVTSEVSSLCRLHM